MTHPRFHKKLRAAAPTPQSFQQQIQQDSALLRKLGFVLPSRDRPMRRESAFCASVMLWSLRSVADDLLTARLQLLQLLPVSLRLPVTQRSVSRCLLSPPSLLLQGLPRAVGALIVGIGFWAYLGPQERPLRLNRATLGSLRGTAALQSRARVLSSKIELRCRECIQLQGVRLAEIMLTLGPRGLLFTSKGFRCDCLCTTVQNDCVCPGSWPRKSMAAFEF